MSGAASNASLNHSHLMLPRLDINHDNKISPEELNSWKDADTFSQLDTTPGK